MRPALGGAVVKFGTDSHQVEVNIPTREALFRACGTVCAGDGFALATLNLDHLTKLPDDPAFLPPTGRMIWWSRTGGPWSGCRNWRASRLS